MRLSLEKIVHLIENTTRFSFIARTGQSLASSASPQISEGSFKRITHQVWFV